MIHFLFIWHILIILQVFLRGIDYKIRCSGLYELPGEKYNILNTKINTRLPSNENTSADGNDDSIHWGAVVSFTYLNTHTYYCICRGGSRLVLDGTLARAPPKKKVIFFLSKQIYSKKKQFRTHYVTYSVLCYSGKFFCMNS